MAGEALSGTGELNQPQDASASAGGNYLDTDKTAGSPILAELESKDKDAQAVAHALFCTTAMILLERAVFLRVAVKVGFVGLSWARSFLRALSWLSRTEREAYGIYRNMNDAANQIAVKGGFPPAA